MVTPVRALIDRIAKRFLFALRFAEYQPLIPLQLTHVRYAACNCKNPSEADSGITPAHASRMTRTPQSLPSFSHQSYGRAEVDE